MQWRTPVSVVVLAVVVTVVVVVTAASIPDAGPSSGRGAGARPPIAVARDRRAPTTTTDADGGLPVLRPTPAMPLRVLEIGDSLGIDLGDQLQTQLDGTGLARTTVASLGDSGLANVAFYDWPSQLAALLAMDRPQVVVVFIGANDDQGLLVDGVAAAPGTVAWESGYAQRVDAVLSEATGAGARVVWVGMPPMADPDLNVAMSVENGIFQRQAEDFPATLYVSSLPVLGDGSGLYEATGLDASGQPAVLRTPDGVHLTPDGAGVLAAAVIAAVDHGWHLSLEQKPDP